MAEEEDHILERGRLELVQRQELSGDECRRI